MKRLTSDCLTHTKDCVYAHTPLIIAIYVIVCLFWGVFVVIWVTNVSLHSSNVLIFIFYPQVTCKSWHLLSICCTACMFEFYIIHNEISVTSVSTRLKLPSTLSCPYLLGNVTVTYNVIFLFKQNLIASLM